MRQLLDSFFLPWQVVWLMLATIIRIYICGNIEDIDEDIGDENISNVTENICVTISRISKAILRTMFGIIVTILKIFVT